MTAPAKPGPDPVAALAALGAVWSPDFDAYAVLARALAGTVTP